MAERLRVITFDVYQTLIRYGEDLIREIGESITRYFNEMGYSVESSVVTEYYKSIEREVRFDRRRGFVSTPPMENVRRLVLKICQRYGIPINNRLTVDVQNVIADTVSNSRRVSAIEGVYELLNMLKEDGWIIGIVSNVIFWPGRVTRSLMTRFGLWKFVTYGAFSDEVGYSKPHPVIFDTLVRTLTGEREPDIAVHVGDNFYEDFLGALMYGMVSVLYDPSGAFMKGEGSPHEVLKCRAYIVRNTKDVATVAEEVSKCSTTY